MGYVSLSEIVSEKSARLEQTMNDINQRLENLWSKEQIESYIEYALANNGEQQELFSM